LAYSFIIEKDVKVKKTFQIEISKFYIKLLDKLLKDKTFVQLLRKSLDVSLYKNYALFYNKHTTIYYSYPNSKKLKVMKLCEVVK
jgi:hypothetical protein